MKRTPTESMLKMRPFPPQVIATSDNARIKEALKRLEHASTLKRISSYTEVHSEWEDKGW